MSLICFFRPDGSGKTTLAKALAEELKSRGFNVRISWMRGTHTLASLLARFLSRFALFRGSDNPYYGISIPNHARRVWQLIEFISVLPILLIRFMLPCFLGYVVIAERYLPDFLVWVSLTTRNADYLKRLEARFLLALSMKADVKVYVTASEAELAKRRGKEVSREFLSRQLKLYDKVAKIVRAYKIDTTQRSVEETLSCLLNLIHLRA
ncbi:MAG TPA: AAA family ATPase [Candidatus Bathyarchaeota archaeon]|nr:AAA family ATPase [Candidatus Bathyarchaeota archaeon]HEX69228.1 AAA family ATPase [Candidatus Bathyarchaeota archaeon]